MPLFLDTPPSLEYTSPCPTFEEIKMKELTYFKPHPHRDQSFQQPFYFHFNRERLKNCSFMAQERAANVYRASWVFWCAIDNYRLIRIPKNPKQKATTAVSLIAIWRNCWYGVLMTSQVLLQAWQVLRKSIVSVNPHVLHAILLEVQ